MVERVSRLLIGFGAILFVGSLLVPWSKLVGGSLAEPILFEGYKEINTYLAAVLGIIIFPAAFLMADLQKLKALGISIGALTLLIPFNHIELIRVWNGNADCLKWPHECGGIVPGNGPTLVYWGCFIIILGSVLAWTAAVNKREKTVAPYGQFVNRIEAN